MLSINQIVKVFNNWNISMSKTMLNLQISLMRRYIAFHSDFLFCHWHIWSLIVIFSHTMIVVYHIHLGHSLCIYFLSLENYNTNPNVLLLLSFCFVWPIQTQMFIKPINCALWPLCNTGCVAQLNNFEHAWMPWFQILVIIFYG